MVQTRARAVLEPACAVAAESRLIQRARLRVPLP
jgi:hypothetical protein